MGGYTIASKLIVCLNIPTPAKSLKLGPCPEPLGAQTLWFIHLSGTVPSKASSSGVFPGRYSRPLDSLLGEGVCAAREFRGVQGLAVYFLGSWNFLSLYLVCNHNDSEQRMAIYNNSPESRSSHGMVSDTSPCRSESEMTRHPAEP